MRSASTCQPWRSRNRGESIHHTAAVKSMLTVAPASGAACLNPNWATTSAEPKHAAAASAIRGAAVSRRIRLDDAPGAVDRQIAAADIRCGVGAEVESQRRDFGGHDDAPAG